MTIKLNNMIRYLLLQFVNIADGDMPTKFLIYQKHGEKWQRDKGF